MSFQADAAGGNRCDIGMVFHDHGEHLAERHQSKMIFHGDHLAEGKDTGEKFSALPFYPRRHYRYHHGLEYHPQPA